MPGLDSESGICANFAPCLQHRGRLPGPALALSAAEAEALRGRFRASELPAEVRRLGRLGRSARVLETGARGNSWFSGTPEMVMVLLVSLQHPPKKG